MTTLSHDWCGPRKYIPAPHPKKVRVWRKVVRHTRNFQTLLNTIS
jgi:hypothetical protein